MRTNHINQLQEISTNINQLCWLYQPTFLVESIMIVPLENKTYWVAVLLDLRMRQQKYAWPRNKWNICWAVSKTCCGWSIGCLMVSGCWSYVDYYWLSSTPHSWLVLHPPIFSPIDGSMSIAIGYNPHLPLVFTWKLSPCSAASPDPSVYCRKRSMVR